MIIKRIHVEASSFCNARCPLCPRNLYGYKVDGVYPEVHLNVEKFKDILSKFPDIINVNFNGNLGDPMMNPNIIELIRLISCSKSITTNGSIGTKNTWIELAKSNVNVVFSIDGLEDTNHLYRQDVAWQKVMERVNWFISAGGLATWKFIVFKHNAHQINQAKLLSKALGFKNFLLEDHGRNYGPVLDKKGNITHWILPADDSLTPKPYDVSAGIKRYKETRHNFFPKEKIYNITCEHEKLQSIYVNAQGLIGPCCYQGFDLPDMDFQPLENFSEIKKSWQTKNCNWICAMNCSR